MPITAHSDTELPISDISASSERTKSYNGRPCTAQRLLEDDSTSTFWNSAGRSNEETITMKLAREAMLDGVLIRWKSKDGPVGARAMNYTVQTSMNSTSWEVVHAHNAGDPNQAEDDVFFKPSLARFVKIHMTDTSYTNDLYFTAKWIKLFGK